MDLTSHEYVVCQEETKNSLVLSEFAGTYGSSGACLRVSPWKFTEVTEAIREGLVMADDEKTICRTDLRKHVCTKMAQFLATDFISELIQVHGDFQRRRSINIPLLNMQVVLLEIRVRSEGCSLRWITMERTPVSYELPSSVRSKGKTSKEDMMKVISHIASDPRNIVYNMGGRTRVSLD
ncbi:glycosyltransferase family 20-domain-containing protein [Dissophora ornata]|nr:glycosyltransferase family 20-domain-containing protein [Dissophora ornata]